MTSTLGPPLRAAACLLAFLAASGAVAVAQTAAASPGSSAAPQAVVPPAPATSVTDPPASHPRRLSLQLHLDLSWGTFGFADTLFSGSEDPAAPAVRDRWFEGLIKPGLDLTYTFPNSSAVFGKASAVGERTYGSLPGEFGLSVASFEVEDLAVGWRSGTALAGMKENALEITVGRAPYIIGNGFLIFDGATDGGARGGYWTNGRKAWKSAAVGRFSPNAHTVEAFYLERNELPEEGESAGLWGLNYEWAPTDQTTLGASYLAVHANADAAPARDGLKVINLRAFTAPLVKVPELAFEFEYAHERNGDAVGANAWTLKSAYTLSALPWSPILSYRYAWFEGDHPGTMRNEAFDPLFLGFTDWGSWWQGEIAGEYFLSNSNLASHQVRLHLDPAESLGTGLIFYQFSLDHPASYAPGVTSRDVGSETDWYMDWKITKRLTLSAVAAFADPGTAVQQASGRTRNLSYGMCYVGWTF